MNANNPDLLAKYFEDYVRKGFNNIFEEQRRIAQSKIYNRQAYRTDGTPRSRSGRLQAALASPNYSISGSDSSLDAKVSYPTYLRFLDMKRLGNYRIYNRPIWGILYKQTFVDLKYEFRDWCESYFSRALDGIFQ